MPTAITNAKLNTTNSPAKHTPTKSLNSGSTLSRRHATRLNPANTAVTPKYSRNCTQPASPPVHAGSNMRFMDSRKLVMNAACDAVSAHHPKVLIHAQRYDPTRPAGVAHSRRTQ